jgi:hypothetical protein
VKDQLTRNERIRVEALAQANARFATTSASTKIILDSAREFEKFIRDADKDGVSQ